jgi:small subunit ribosomal protein S18
MAFGKSAKKTDFKKKPLQNPLFKRKRYCRFTVGGVSKLITKTLTP